MSLRQTAEARAFLEDVLEVCKRHRLSLGHEDSQGNFMVQPYSVVNASWLLRAEDTTFVEPPEIEEDE